MTALLVRAEASFVTGDDRIAHSVWMVGTTARDTRLH
jgi:hypothetical protein